MYAVFCHSDEENVHRACTGENLTTADQNEMRRAYLDSVMSTRKIFTVFARVNI